MRSSQHPELRKPLLESFKNHSSVASELSGSDGFDISPRLEPEAYSDSAESTSAAHKQSSLEHRKIIAALGGNPEGRFFVGSSPEMMRVYGLIRKFAPNDAPVLITGETGTGKELAAAALHERSARAEGPFIPINCAALPASLISSELFGYERGSFTGAQTRKIGLIEAANKGTLFLDEIGHLPIELQGYLLRFLQEKHIQRVGSLVQTPVDVRIIAATNVDLPSMIETKEFRADLFYRINVLSINLPPLRSRGNDVLTLVEFFIRKFISVYGKKIRGVTPECLRILTNYAWPGNVRELASCLQRAVLVCDGEWISSDDLNLPDFNAQKKQPEAVFGRRAANEMRSLDPIQEKKLLLEALSNHGGNITRAAKSINISRLTFYRSLQKHGLSSAIENLRHDARVAS